MLDSQRQQYATAARLPGGNMLNLLSHLHCDLRSIDFSHLVIRQAYLQVSCSPQFNFAHAHFISSIFSNTFGNILQLCAALFPWLPTRVRPYCCWNGTGRF